MFGGDPGHQILKSRVNDVGLESPDDEIPGVVVVVGTMNRGDKSREASVGNHHKPLVFFSLIGSLKNNRFAIFFSTAQFDARKGVLGADPEEKVFGRLIQFLYAGNVPRRSFRRRGKA